MFTPLALKLTPVCPAGHPAKSADRLRTPVYVLESSGIATCISEAAIKAPFNGFFFVEANSLRARSHSSAERGLLGSTGSSLEMLHFPLILFSAAVRDTGMTRQFGSAQADNCCL